MIVICPTLVNGRYVMLDVRHNGFEWTVVDDSTYEPGCPVGLGKSVQDAINDWIEQLTEVAA
jgi:hypothetical protein